MNDYRHFIILYRRIAVLIMITMALSAKAGKLSKENLAYLYAGNDFTSTEWIAYHVSENTTRIYGNIHLKDFTYRHAWNSDGSSKTHFMVSYNLLEVQETKIIIDSATYTFSDSLFFGNDMNMVINFDVPAVYPGDYILKIWLTDLNSPENNVINYLPIFKKSPYSDQNFLVRNREGFPVFDRFLDSGEKFKLQYRDTDQDQLNVRYYNRDFPLAEPPFALDKRETYTFKPDSFYVVKLDSGMSQLLEFPYKGIYFLQPDINNPTGLTLIRFENDFPEVNSAKQAIEPLRYLTIQPEFDKLKKYKDYKIAIDSFWLDRASFNPARAKKMIKRFYSRVQESNQYFTSYQEGWKTDRGLIYIVYGPPSEVYRKPDEEEWIYGERGNPLSIRFFFDKVENPFTENDFSLQRSPVYKTSWFIAIENWRR